MEARIQGRKLQELLHTRTRPIAIAFREAAPEGVARIDAPRPAGCGYWKAAAEGAVFYTESSDHHGCPVGAHTHNVDLPPDVAKELEGLVGTMIGLEYLAPEDVAAIPRRRDRFGVAIYAPVTEAPVEPDVVLVLGNVRELMLLAEAAQSAGVQGETATLGRPTCAVLPQALGSGRTASSFGCVGNRVYTGAGDDEGYFAIPGAQLGAVVARLATMVKANAALEEFHRSRTS